MRKHKRGFVRQNQKQLRCSQPLCARPLEGTDADTNYLLGLPFCWRCSEAIGGLAGSIVNRVRKVI